MNTKESKTTETSLRMAVVPQSHLNFIESKINTLEALLRAKKEEEINGEWIPSPMIPKLLDISQKTWQTYRDKRIIPFSQIGSKIFVQRADLEEFMRSHYISAKR